MSTPKTIGAAKFKEGCLKLLEELPEEGLIITKNGRPVARVTPLKGPHAHLIGCLKGELVVTGDVFTTDIAWDAQS